MNNGLRPMFVTIPVVELPKRDVAKNPSSFALAKTMMELRYHSIVLKKWCRDSAVLIRASGLSTVPLFDIDSEKLIDHNCWYIYESMDKNVPEWVRQLSTSGCCVGVRSNCCLYKNKLEIASQRIFSKILFKIQHPV